MSLQFNYEILKDGFWQILATASKHREREFCQPDKIHCIYITDTDGNSILHFDLVY